MARPRPTCRTNVILDAADLKKLKSLADREHTSVSHLIRQMIRDFLLTHKKGGAP